MVIKSFEQLQKSISNGTFETLYPFHNSQTAHMKYSTRQEDLWITVLLHQKILKIKIFYKTEDVVVVIVW
jgi:hypothetical protein